MSNSTGILSLKDVRKTYHLGDTKIEALKGVSLEIKKGEFTTVIGRSGSGKTTLLNIIGCIDNAESGEIRLDNQIYSQLTSDQKSDLRNRRIGYVFQAFHLIPVLNALENVMLPLLLRKEFSTQVRKQKARSCLDQVGLANLELHKPHQLSGGQRQRVAIARAMVVEPDLILADEPTANLDSETAEKIIDLLLKLNDSKGVTFVFSTHDEKLMRRVTRVLEMKDGVLVAS